ncbi:MAG: PAS domain S-box protein [Acidobacteriota bacterium]
MSEERFRLLFQQAAVGIKRMDPRGRILEVNDRYCDILGYERDELLQLSLRDITHPEDLLREEAELGRLLAREIPGYNLEKRCFRRDGGIIWIRVTSSLPSGAGGATWWWISVVQDITRRKQAEESLQRTAEELAQSNMDLEQFAYAASHDLQEPLRAVAGFMSILRKQYRDKLDADARDYIDQAVEGAERMQTLINDLLTYSRVGTKGGAFKPLNMKVAVDAAMNNLQVAIDESDALVTSDSLPTVTADASQMTQLLQNLIGNAIKFRGERRPEIHIRGRREDRQEIFSVSDNGIGIEPF